MKKLAIAFALVVASLPGHRTAQAEDATQTYTPGQKVEKTFDAFAQVFLDSYCLNCHDETIRKGNLSLEDLGPIDETNADLWKSIWAQIALQEMPPREKKTQPGIIERLQMSDWIVAELQHVMQDKGGFKAHLDPGKGNFVNHDLLFGPLPAGIKLVPTSSPARLWRVTPQEHITRLNELINTEPNFDPTKPGLRTRGDAVPTNHGGELKIYFGVDRINRWQGGTVAYATSVKSVPAVLSSAKSHGLENYPDFYTVNSAEAMQILAAADDILRYMAYGPLSIAEPEQITDDPRRYKFDGDLRGLPSAILYRTKVVRPLTPVYEFMKQEGATDEQLRAAADDLFESLTFRPPSEKESDEYLALAKQSIDKLGKIDGAFLGLSAIFLDRDALFRPELVEYGEPDAHSRVMLQDWELGLAVNHALSYIKPDKTLKAAIQEGRMRAREDVEREVSRILADNSIRKPRVLQFFRDYFDYDLGGYICKDSTALARSGPAAGTRHYRAMFDATASTDRLIELILQEDKDVLKQLLTTDKAVATHNDGIYFGEKRSAKSLEETQEQRKQFNAQIKAIERQIAEQEEALEKVDARRKRNPEDPLLRSEFVEIRQGLMALQGQAELIKSERAEIKQGVLHASLHGKKIFARVGHMSFGKGSLKPERTLATAPEGQRLGILTHPSWLVSHSDAMDNHAIHRGIWIQNRLLGGAIPDVPITVDAMLPDEPQKTLRERMRVTQETYCWTCHKKMDPLGLPFEMYNHAGLFRTEELGKPVDTTGEIIESGVPELDGPVANAIELIQKLAESERAEQVFVRHAFRFWMGRNETLNDAPVLQAAHRTYRDSGGSMNALLTSLLTSDAFLYRTVDERE